MTPPVTYALVPSDQQPETDAASVPHRHSTLLRSLLLVASALLMFAVGVLFTFGLSPFSCLADSSESPPSLSSAVSQAAHLLPVYRRFHPRWPNVVPARDEEQLRLAWDRSSALPFCTTSLTGQPSDAAGNWSLSPLNELRFNPPGCRLRRPSASQAQQCLAGQSLSFIGDSLNRYQYMSLLAFLSEGEWPEGLGGLPGLPSLVIESEWPDWPTFFNVSLVRFNGSETCECSRTSGMRERRHVYLPSSGITLRHTFTAKLPAVLAAFHDIKAEWETAADGGNRTSYSFNADYFAPAPCPVTKPPPADCLYRSDVPFHPPSFILVNIGHWYGADDPVPRLNLTLPIRDFFGPDFATRLMWRTTNPMAGAVDVIAGSHEDELLAFRNSSIWETIDVFTMTAQKPGVTRSYWDPRHFLPFVYEEINVWLLNLLCDDRWRWVKKR